MSDRDGPWKKEKGEKIMLKFIAGFLIGTLFGWKILNWLIPKIINFIGG